MGCTFASLPMDELARQCRPFFEAAGIGADLASLERIAPIIKERIRTLDEAVELAGFFFRDDIEQDAQALIPEGLTAAQAAAAARRAHDLLAGEADFEALTLETHLRALADDLGLTAGQLFTILREAVTGQRVSPPLTESMQIIGKQTVLERLTRVADLLDAQPA